MATSITCPECDAVLKPARPVPPGKAIKCPRCGAGFVAPGDEAAPRAKPKAGAAPVKKGAARKGSDKPAARPAARTAGKKGSDKVTKKPGGADKGAPAPAKKDRFEDDDDGGDMTYGVTQEEEKDENKPAISYAPDTSIKDLRGPAQEAVVRPTNLLVLTGVLGFVGYLALLVIILIPVLFPLATESTDKNRPTPVLEITGGLGTGASGAIQKQTAEKKEDPSMFIVLGFDLGIFAFYPWFMLLLYLMPIFVGMAYCGVVIMGAVKTQNLESREWGIVSCIMTMVPYNSAGLAMVLMLVLNILFNMLFDDPAFVTLMLIVFASLLAVAEVGVAAWALVVLMKEEVIAGFEYKAE